MYYFPTVIFNTGLKKMYDKIRILVGYDESPQSKNAVKEAIAIATCFSGFVKVIYVYGKGMEGKAETAVVEVKEKLNEAKVEHDVSLVLGSNPAKALLTIAKKENIALIVVGNRGLGNTLSLLLGSVSKQIVANSHCNVLVVKD